MLTMATAWFGDGLIRRARTLGRYIGWASATLLRLAGAYIAESNRQILIYAAVH